LKIHPGLLIGILIAAFFGISLFFRIYLPYGKIFVDDWIKMSSIDVYFYMRLVDNLVYNFPHLTQFDPYLIYPGGGGVGSLSFFHQLQAGFIWIIGLGSPTQHTVDVVGAYFPTVLAALTIIPVYFIGKTLFNKWAGLLAAGLIAILPGEFMGRSILGGGDNPIAETLFTTTALAFLILAIKTAGQRQLSFKSIRLVKRLAKIPAKRQDLRAPVHYWFYLFAGILASLFTNLTRIARPYGHGHFRPDTSGFMGYLPAYVRQGNKNIILSADNNRSGYSSRSYHIRRYARTY